MDAFKKEDTLIWELTDTFTPNSLVQEKAKSEEK